jgi:hypothetical protein
VWGLGFGIEGKPRSCRQGRGGTGRGMSSPVSPELAGDVDSATNCKRSTRSAVNVLRAPPTPPPAGNLNAEPGPPSLPGGSRRANKRWDVLPTPPSRPCYSSPTGPMALMRPSSKGRWGSILSNNSITQLLSCQQLQAHTDHRIPSPHP